LLVVVEVVFSDIHGVTMRDEKDFIFKRYWKKIRN
jgi:hypothetical protein